MERSFHEGSVSGLEIGKGLSATRMKDLSCNSRTPKIGDQVRTTAGKLLADDQTNHQWRIDGKQIATVVEVDAEGDFKLNCEGEVSGWMFRNNFEYAGEKHNDSESTDAGSMLSSSRASSDDGSPPISPSHSDKCVPVTDDFAAIASFAAQHAAKEWDIYLRQRWMMRLVHGRPVCKQGNTISPPHNYDVQKVEPDQQTSAIEPPPGLPSPKMSEHDDLLSVGSALHGQGTCQPCAWFWKPQGCQNGYNCNRCHLCPDGELKSRKRGKRDILRAMEKQLVGAGGARR